MESNGFYKLDDSGDLLYAPNFVYGAYDEYRLFKEQKDSYTYPVQGWYWFNSLEEANQFFI